MSTDAEGSPSIWIKCKGVWEKHQNRIIGGTFSTLAFGITILIVLINSGKKPASGRENLAYILIGGILQIIGASYFNKDGKADPTLARTAVRDLKGLLLRIRKSRVSAENAYELQDPTEGLKVLGILSSDLSWIEEYVSHAVNNWTEFHPDAVKKVEEIDQS